MAAHDPLRILFVGNSYTARNEVPRLVEALAARAEPPLEIEATLIFAGGASLRRHWNAGHARDAIASGRFAWVVLQEMSTLPVKNAARYHENVRLFDEAIGEAGARMALYHTWSRRDAPHAQAAIDEAVATIARESNARVVPVGPAWRETMRRHPALALYADDGSHPTAAGSYLAACVFLVHLLDRLPRGYDVAARIKLSREDAATLHDVAAASR